MVGKNLPIILISINEGMHARIKNSNKCCKICEKSLVNMKVGDLLLRKTAGRSFVAHVDCGISKNWITKKQFDKLYLPLVSLRK